MEALKQRILQDGTIIDNRILKIDNFLNHQIDTELVLKMGEEFAKRLKDVRIDRIVTIEASPSPLPHPWPWVTSPSSLRERKNPYSQQKTYI